MTSSHLISYLTSLSLSLSLFHGGWGGRDESEPVPEIVRFEVPNRGDTRIFGLPG